MEMMYKLWRWRAWGFGGWALEAESASIDSLRLLVKGRPSLTYKITKGDFVVEQHKAAGHHWRTGMVHPSGF